MLLNRKDTGLAIWRIVIYCGLRHKKTTGKGTNLTGRQCRLKPANDGFSLSRPSVIRHLTRSLKLWPPLTPGGSRQRVGHQQTRWDGGGIIGQADTAQRQSLKRAGKDTHGESTSSAAFEETENDTSLIDDCDGALATEVTRLIQS